MPRLPDIIPLTPLTVLVVAGAAAAGPIEAEFPLPHLDRWMYPFGATPGVETQASVFGAVGLAGFDDRDAQFLVGFDTSGAVPTGLGSGQYRLVGATLTVRVAREDAFAYDPTHDTLETYLDPADPDHQPDGDAGRPVELFCAGYRGGFDALSYTETSPFGGAATVPPAEGARFVFAADYDAGEATDLSNNVRQRIEAAPIAVGAIDGLAPGAPVGVETEMVFEIDPCAASADGYFADALDLGRLNLVVSSLHFVEFGSTDNPTFFTKEHPLGGDPFYFAASLTLTVMLTDDADLNGDGVKDIFDFLEFQDLFAVGDPLADFSGDCTLDIFDFLAFQDAFAR